MRNELFRLYAYLTLALVTVFTFSDTFAQSEKGDLRINAPVISIDYNENKILIAYIGHELYLYNLMDSEGRFIATEYQDIHLMSAKFIPNTSMIVIATQDGLLIFYDWFLDETIQTYYVNIEMTSLTVSSDGYYLVVGGWGNRISLYAINRTANISQIADYQIANLCTRCSAIDTIWQLQFINVPNVILIRESSGSIYIWDTQAGSMSRLFSGDGNASSIDYLEDRNQILATFLDKFVIWDMSTASTILEHSLAAQPYFSVMIGDRIIIGYRTGNVETYSWQGVKLSTFSLLNEVLIAAFLSEDNDLILGFSNGSIIITQLGDG